MGPWGLRILQEMQRVCWCPKGYKGPKWFKVVSEGVKGYLRWLPGD